MGGPHHPPNQTKPHSRTQDADAVMVVGHGVLRLREVHVARGLRGGGLVGVAGRRLVLVLRGRLVLGAGRRVGHHRQVYIDWEWGI